jgi:hypothetical protein
MKDVHGVKSRDDVLINEEALHRVKEGRYILRRIEGGRLNEFVTSLCTNYRLINVTEGKIKEG